MLDAFSILVGLSAVFVWLNARTLNFSSGVVTLSAISQIQAIEQQAKWLKSHASAFAAVGEFRSI
jgi:hypothetical protein